MKLEIALAGSPILYHIIDLKHATTALKKNQLRLAPMAGSKFEADLGKGAFFLSLARSPSSDYIANSATYGNKVIFVFDGVKLGHNYSVKPVNYWHNNEYNKSDEMEDRLYANKPYIPLMKYLKEVHFRTDPNWNGSDTLDIILKCKMNKIPVYQYSAWEDLLELKKKAAVPFTVTKSRSKFGSGYEDYESQVLWNAIRRDFRKHPVLENGKPSRYATLLEGVTIKRHAQAARTLVDKLRYGLTTNDIEAAIARRDTERSEKYANKINAYMRKHKLTAADLVQQLMEKWK